MLNTVFEEIDKQKSSEQQKNRKIKIKLNKKEGMKDSQVIFQTLAESRIIFSDSLPYSQQNPQQLVQHQALQPTPHQDLAEQFLSQSRAIVEKTRKYHEERRYSIQKNPLYQSEAVWDRVQPSFDYDLPKQKHIPLTYSRIDKDQILFQSHVVQRDQNEEMSFILPRAVTKLFETEYDYVNLLEEHTKNQKLKIDLDFNNLRDSIYQIINEVTNIQSLKQRMHLFKEFDNVLDNFKQNFLYLKKKIADFKESQKSVHVQLKKNTLLSLKGLTYFEKTKQDVYTKIKEEKQHNYINNIRVNLKARVENIEAEVSKKAMSFMAEQIEQQIFNKPLYGSSECQHVYYYFYKKSEFNKIRNTILELVQQNLLKTNEMLQTPPLFKLKNLTVLPKMEITISEERNSVLGGEKDLAEQEYLKKTLTLKLSMTQSRIQSMGSSLGLGNAVKGLGLQLQAKFQTNHDNHLMSMLAVTDEIVATACKSGQVMIWNIQLGKLLLKYQASRTSVNALRLFKGNPSDFRQKQLQADYFTNKKTDEEKSYVCSGGGMGDSSIKIWDINQNICMVSLIGHQSAITSIIALRDQHTLISASDDCSIRFWNTYTGQILKKVEHNQASVNVIALTKDGSLISGSSDRTIHIYKIQYIKSQVYGRYVFGDCTISLVLEDTAQIYSLNASQLDENIILSGGSDAKIKIWNTQTKQIIQEIFGHKSPVGDMIILENPFDLEKQKIFSIVSVGTGDDIIRISSSMSSLNNGSYIQEKICCDYGATTSPLMQLIKDSTDNSVKILVINQSEEGQYFVMLQLI